MFEKRNNNVAKQIIYAIFHVKSHKNKGWEKKCLLYIVYIFLCHCLKLWNNNKKKIKFTGIGKKL